MAFPHPHAPFGADLAGGAMPAVCFCPAPLVGDLEGRGRIFAGNGGKVWGHAGVSRGGACAFNRVHLFGRSRDAGYIIEKGSNAVRRHGVAPFFSFMPVPPARRASVARPRRGADDPWRKHGAEAPPGYKRQTYRSRAIHPPPPSTHTGWAHAKGRK